MPKPTKNETREKFISRCIPMLIKEGRKKEQAVAICFSMWRERNKK